MSERSQIKKPRRDDEGHEEKGHAERFRHTVASVATIYIKQKTRVELGLRQCRSGLAIASDHDSQVRTCRKMPKAPFRGRSEAWNIV